MIFREWIKGMIDVYPDTYKGWLNELIMYADTHKVDETYIESMRTSYRDDLFNSAVSTFPLSYCGMAYYTSTLLDIIGSDTSNIYANKDNINFGSETINCLFKRMSDVLEASGKTFDGKTIHKNIADAYSGNKYKEKTLIYLDKIRSLLRFVYALDSEVVGNNIKPIFGDGKSISISNWLSLMQSFIVTEKTQPDIGSIIEKTNLYLSNKKHEIILYPAHLISKGYEESLHKSCQNNRSASSVNSLNYSTLYYNCFNNIRLLALLNGNNQVQARCLLWKVGRTNEYVVDRVYDYNDISGFFDIIRGMIGKEVTLNLKDGGKETIKIVDMRNGKLTTSSNSEFRGWIVGGPNKMYYSKQYFDNEDKKTGDVTNLTREMPWFDSCKMIRIKEVLDRNICFVLGGNRGTLEKFKTSRNHTVATQYNFVSSQPCSIMYQKYALRIGANRKWSKRGLFSIGNGMYDSIENLKILVDSDGNVSMTNTQRISEQGMNVCICGMNKTIYENIKALDIKDATGESYDILEYIKTQLNTDTIVIIEHSDSSAVPIVSCNIKQYLLDKDSDNRRKFYMPKNMTRLKLVRHDETSSDKTVLISGKHIVTVDCLDITSLNLDDDKLEYVKLDKELYHRNGSEIYVEEKYAILDNENRYILKDDANTVNGITFLQDYGLGGLIQWQINH